MSWRVRRFLPWMAAILTMAGGARIPAQSLTPQLTPTEVPFDFYERGPYREEVPRPAKLLGYEPGEFHTTYANYERYLRELESHTDRLKVMTLGQTPEHRPLYLLAVSSPENIAHLDAIQADIARLADPRTCSQADADSIAARTPMIVWLSYSIHGDESSAFEAGLQVLYQLCASDEPELDDILKKCVVLINPAQNPDGHERFTAWYNAEGIGRPEAFAYEHRQPWGIWGRFNHYGFDLNRDLLAISQIESRVASAAFLAWHPQVNADHHGETKNFFFPPPALPINSALPHDETEHWQSVLGQGNAAAFNRYHWLYYNRDVFDLYYPGYWDSWPSLHGSTGMTFESDGGGKRGFNWKRDDGTIETLRIAIAKHFTASLATLETSAAHREERLKDYYKFYATALQEGQAGKGGLRTVVISPGDDPGKTANLIGNLLRQGIEVRWSTAKLTLADAHSFFPADDSAAASREFPKGSYIIDLAQPQGRVARTLLAPDAPLDPAFAKRQLERQARNLKRGRREPLEHPEFYDITAWALPLAFGANAAYSAEPPPPVDAVTQYVREATSTGIKASVSSATAAAPAQTVVTCSFAGPDPARVATAYLWTPESESAYRLSFRLLREGYRLATTTEPMRADGWDCPRGTVLARVERNPASLHDRVTALAKEYGVVIKTADTAYVDKGSVGPGSEEVISLKVPKVALIAGDQTTQTSYAEISYLLGKDMGVEFVPMSVSAFKGTRMADFNVLILPDGNAKSYAGAFGKEGVEKLKDWCKEGGTLICVGGAAGFAADKKVNLTAARVVGADQIAMQDDDDADSADADKGADKEEKNDEKPDAKKAAPPSKANDPDKKNDADEAPKKSGENDAEQPPADKKKGGFDRRKIPLPVPGAIFRATVNRDHFLTYGYEADTLPVLVDTDQFLTLTRRGANVVSFPAGDGNAPSLRIAGFEWPDNTERLLRGTASVIEEPMGDGHVILTSNGPSYRLLWRAGTRLWLNGVLYAPAMKGEED